MACSTLFHFLQATLSQNILTNKFTKNHFITKDCKRHCKVGQLKGGKALKIGIGIKKQHNFHLKVEQ